LIASFVTIACAFCVGCEVRDGSPAGEAGRAESRANVAESGMDLNGLARGRIAFVDGFERGYQMAREQQKPMFIFFTAGWCKFCHQMANETFVQEAVVQLSTGFVCVLIDADAEPDVCRQFDVRSFPTVQFVSSRGVRLNRVTGKQPAHQLIAQMQAALQAIARRPDLTTQR
jgi:thioredoxin-related protein